MAGLARVRVSGNQRFLETEEGEPFFWLGDTAWELFHRLTREEAEQYLENRREKEFSVIQAVILAEVSGLRVPNAYGHLPLIDEDPTKPNEAYFEHVDAVVGIAEEKGMYVGLLPTWGDKVRLDWGEGPVIFTEENAFSYGKFVGERYRRFSNIIWVIGGDRNSEGYEAVWNALAHGVEAGLGEKGLMTYHPMGGHTSSSHFHQESWLDMNMQQSGHNRADIPNWEKIEHDYGLLPVKPVLDGEPNYEDHAINWKKENGYFQAYDVRKQSYRSVFAGGCGVTYGNQSIWQFYQEGREPVAFPAYSWQEAMDHPGAAQMRHLKHLMLSRPYFSRIPDQSLLLSEVGEGGQHMRATRDQQGSYAFIYMPNNMPNTKRTIEVDTDKLSGSSVTAWWFDPRTGSATRVGEFPKGGARSFTTPEEGPDWVLVLDDTEANFVEPGRQNAQ